MRPGNQTSAPKPYFISISLSREAYPTVIAPVIVASRRIVDFGNPEVPNLNNHISFKENVPWLDVSVVNAFEL